MADKALIFAFVLGIGILSLGMLVPSLVETTTEDASTTIQVNNQTQTNITNNLELEVSRVNNSESTTNVTLRNLRTFATNNSSVDETNTTALALSGDNISVTNQAVVDNDTVRLGVVYPPMFAWNGGARAFVANLDIIMILLGFTLIMAPMVSLL